MWKCITRGIRESLERRVCRTNVYSQPSNDESACIETKPSVDVKNDHLDIEHNKHQGGFCSFFNYRGAKDKKHNTDWGKCTQRTFSDVLGWSSVLAFGWIICQTPCIRKHIFERNQHNKQHCRFSQLPKPQISHLLTQTLNIQPKHIFPVTNCIAKSEEDLAEDSDEWLRRNAYGPITVENALKAAKDDFTLTHRIVMGEFELKFGVKAIGEKKYAEAIKHFSTGAKLSSPGSLFNLGICYELGIGTLTDTIKAAKYYREAADKGHAGAMYNLGVFHAQGRGGLPINLNVARELFTKAASLGQIQAKQALDLEDNRNEIDESNHTSSSVPFKLPEKSNEMKDNFFSRDEEFSNDSSRNSENEDGYGSMYSDSEIQSQPDVFLNFLGIHSNPIFLAAAK